MIEISFYEEEVVDVENVFESPCHNKNGVGSV